MCKAASRETWILLLASKGDLNSASEGRSKELQGARKRSLSGLSGFSVVCHGELKTPAGVPGCVSFSQPQASHPFHPVLAVHSANAQLFPCSPHPALTASCAPCPCCSVPPLCAMAAAAGSGAPAVYQYSRLQLRPEPQLPPRVEHILVEESGRAADIVASALGLPLQ